MRRIERFVIGGFVVAAALLVALGAVSAQQQAQGIIINYPEMTEDGDSQQLGLYFTVVDSSGQAVPEANVSGAQILLGDGTLVDATVDQPDTPLYITMVLDASGSMSGAAADMRAAAIDAVNNAPLQAQFAIIQFNLRDNIEVLQGFTADRNTAINAIGRVQPVANSGTCLYDATMRALALMADARPPARRAVILFTDGRDEITFGGDPCSNSSESDVIDLATQTDLRIPIHTIGLRGDRPIDEASLRNMATATGGLTQIGSQESLGDLFTRIMAGLRSQWIARAEVCLPAGSYSALLTVFTGGSSRLSPAATDFETTTTCLPEPTPTPTNTPEALEIYIESFNFTPDSEMVLFEIRRAGDGDIDRYRIQVNDANRVQRLNTFVEPATDSSVTVVALDVAGLQDGNLELVISALDANDNVLFRLQEDGFIVQRPTPTPTITPTATPTDIPVVVTLNSISYDRGADAITLNVTLQNESQVQRTTVEMIDRETNLLERTYSPTLAEVISIGGEGLEPGRTYVARLIVETAGGGRLVSEQEFLYDPLLTPTPTQTAVPTETPTPTPTPTFSIGISTIELDADRQEFVIPIDSLGDPSLVSGFRVRIVNAETSVLQREIQIEGVPDDNRVRVSVAGLPGGDYEIAVQALDAEEQTLASTSLQARYTPPTAPTATPEPGMFERVSESFEESPATAAGVIVVLLVVLLLIFWFWRNRGRTQQTAIWHAPEPTSAGIPYFTGEDGDDRTMIDIPDIPAEMQGTIKVIRSKDDSVVGRELTVSSVLFTIGRRNCDLTLGDDPNVSRTHVEITFEDGDFFIVDRNSANGTWVNEARLEGGQRYKLIPPHALLRLGKSTEIEFHFGDDKTDLDQTLTMDQ